jgi:hypothetical protein
VILSLLDEVDSPLPLSPFITASGLFSNASWDGDEMAVRRWALTVVWMVSTGIVLPGQERTPAVEHEQGDEHHMAHCIPLWIILAKLRASNLLAVGMVSTDRFSSLLFSP